MKNSRYLVHIGSVVAMMIWGMSYIWSTQVFKYLNPSTTIFFRLIISVIFMTVILLLTKRLEKIKKEELPLFFLAAFLEPFLYFIFESYGLLYASPIISSTFIATIPLFTPIAARFFLKEHLSTLNIMGFVCSFIGVVVMLINKNLQLTSSPVGIIFLLLAVIVAVAYSISLRKLSLLYNPLTVTLIQNIIGCIYFIPMFFIMEKNTPSDFTGIGTYIIPLLCLGMFCSSVAYCLWTFAYRKLGASKANVYSNLIPVFTAIFSYFILKESVTTAKITGILLVFTGLILSQSKIKRHDNE